MITVSEALEIARLSGLCSTARCRRVAVHFGHGGPNETHENTEERCERAAQNFLEYLQSITQE